jgi:branched-chain amino acid transport system ATP-binding protein
VTVPILSIKDTTIERAGLAVVRKVSLAAESGQVTVLLGANGAGKTTLLEGISGATPVRSGEITLAGKRIERLRAWRRARLGVAHVEQNRTVFRDLTVTDNLRVACRGSEDVGRAFDLFPALRRQSRVSAGLLSGGEQQMLVISRALLGDPKVLLIDEMSLGLAPVVLDRLTEAVRGLADDGVAVLLVEQFATLALSIADHAYVLAKGEIVFDGEAAQLSGDEELLRGLYLGEAAAR